MIEFYNRKSMVRKSNLSASLVALRSFLNENEPSLVRVLGRLWKAQGKAITYKQIRKDILAYDGSRLYTDQLLEWQQDYVKFIRKYLSPAWAKAMKTSAAQVKQKNVLWEFDEMRSGVQQWLTDRGAELCTNIAQAQTEALRDVISYSVSVENITVNDLAMAIRPTIGLTSPQAVANMRYYATLRANDIPADRALGMSVQYAERQHRNRAMMVARTELATAYNQGEYFAVKQAQNDGLMGRCVKVWSTAYDERVCKICGSMDGVTAGIDEEFPLSMVKTPPAHPNCRCGYLIKEVEPPIQSQNYIEVGDMV